MDKIVIGLVGEKRGGKGTFTEEFIKLCPPNTVTHHRFSDILYSTLKEWGIETSRGNLQQLSIAMKNTFGDGTLMRAVETRARNASTQIVILDGIRWLEDETLIRKFASEENCRSYLIYITASPETRYDRALKSAEKVGENTLTSEQFMAAEQVETERYIPQIGSRADIRVDNDGTTKKNFLTKVKKIYKAIEPLIETKN